LVFKLEKFALMFEAAKPASQIVPISACEPVWLLPICNVLPPTVFAPPAAVVAAPKESMSDDPDFPKANHALQVLRRARLSRNEAAAIMLGDLVYEMAATGLQTPEIEEAHQAAWIAISKA
jgi:hypothetical protein